MPVAKRLLSEDIRISRVCAQMNATSVMLTSRKEGAISTGETQKDLTPIVIHMVLSI